MARRQLPRDRDRLVQCTDAIVAIAITLLVLPLVDLVGEAAKDHTKSVEVITDHWPQILSFLLSFGVIALFWRAHQRVFEYVEIYNGPLLAWNLLWALTIVALPFPTEMVGAFGSDRFTLVFYVGTLFVNSLFLAAMTVVVSRSPQVTGSQTLPPSGAMIATGALALTLLLVAVLPKVTYLPLLLLLLLLLLLAPPVLDRVFKRSDPKR